MTEYAVKVDHITKSFAEVIANNDVSLHVAKGEIHGLVGENGAGKTTLMNILYGLVQPDEGEIFVYGKKVNIYSPHDAIDLGIGMVHQDFMLSPSMTVLENIILGKTPTRFGLNDIKKAKRIITDLMENYSLAIDLGTRVYQLSVGQMQRVEIIKALYRGAHILILDEPTSVLTPQKADELFKVLRGLIKIDCTVIFITHKLREVLAVTDNITVMRRGVVTGERETQLTTQQELAKLMVGRDVILQVDKPFTQTKGELLSVKDLHALNARGNNMLKGINLNIHSGEIVGIAGVEGNGQTELVEVLTGLRQPTEGNVIFDHKNITHASVKERRLLGMAHIPANRMLLGVCKTCTIEENLILNKYDSPLLSRGLALLIKNIERFSSDLIDRFNIATPNGKLAVGSLSGGNMQKVVVARELEGNPKLLIAAQPTRGVDIGAIEFIHKQIIDLRGKGAAILLVSFELDEILSLSDRILVIYEGKITGAFINENLNGNELGLYMTGAKHHLPEQINT